MPQLWHRHNIGIICQRVFCKTYVSIILINNFRVKKLEKHEKIMVTKTVCDVHREKLA